jgi:hypothetical protein
MCRLRRARGTGATWHPLYLPRVYAQCILAGMSVPLTLPGLLERKPSQVILVTNDARVAAYADRQVIVHDGQVTRLTGARP